MIWMPVTYRRSTQTCSRSIWTLRWIPGTNPGPRTLRGRASKPRASTPKSSFLHVMNNRKYSANLVHSASVIKPIVCLLSSTAHFGFFFPAFKLFIVTLSTIFLVCREAWAASSAGIISVLWCRFSPASTDPRRLQCNWTRVSWEHRWWLCQQLLPDSELGRYNETFADPC